MRKSTTIKLALFMFLSTIICLIGNNILYLDVLSYVSQGLGFLAYLFAAIWICQIIYGKTRFSTNIVVLFMSFALALYSGVMFSVTTTELLFEYYVLFFYTFVLLCLVSAIVLVGRVIFYSPKADEAKEEPVAKKTVAKEIDTWTCTCGAKNTGKFCSECGASAPNAEERTNA